METFQGLSQNLLVIRCSTKEQKTAMNKLLKKCKVLGGFTYPIIIHRALKLYKASRE